jgi:peptide/nickel transport system permease protein
MATLAAIVFVGVAAPLLAPYDPVASGDLVADRLQPPSARHPLGTDLSARDVASRLAYGTRVSIATAALAAVVVLVVGVAWGGAAGLATPVVDAVMMRIVDAALAMPRLIIVLALVAFIGRISPLTLALVLGLTGWPSMSRIVRARVRELAASDHVAAARALGVSPLRLLVRHVLPGAAPAIVVHVVVTVAAVIPLEAALSYFGVGIAPPTPSWGSLLQDAGARPIDGWWLLVFPSLAIAATLLSVNVLGEHLQRRDGATRTGRAA